MFTVRIAEGFQVREEAVVTRSQAARRVRTLRRYLQRDGYLTRSLEVSPWRDDDDLTIRQVVARKASSVVLISVAA